MLSMQEMLEKRNEILGDNIDEEYVNVDSSSTSSFDVTAISPPSEFSDVENNLNSSSINTTSIVIPPSLSDTTNTRYRQRPPPLSNMNLTTPPRPPPLSNMNLTTPPRPPPLPIINPRIEQPVFTFDPNLIQRRVNSSPNLEYGNINPTFDGVYSRRRRHSSKNLYLGILGGLITVVSLIVVNDYLLLSGKI